MKKFLKILIVIIVILFVLVLFRNPIIKSVVTAGASHVMGTKVTIDSFKLGILKPAVSIKGFKIYNPKGFPKGILININEVTVEYDLGAILKGNLHLPLIVLDLEEMILVKNKDGNLNVDSLKVVKEQAEAKDKKAENKPKPKKDSKQMAIQIDEARLNLGKVIVKDYSKGGKQPSITAFDIGVENKIYKDINSAEKLATLVMLEAMGPTAFKSAAIYGAASVLGVAFLPAGIAGVLISKDSSTAEFMIDIEKAYNEVVGLLKNIGEIAKQDPNAKTIKAKVYGADVNVTFESVDNKKTKILIKARQIMLPKPEIAEGIMYQISELFK